MVDFKTYSLAFTFCSRGYAFTLSDISLPVVYVVLHLQSTRYSELVNCSFHDNLGTALAVNNRNITLAGSSVFIHNRACGNITLGGAIIALSSNLTFVGNTTFLDNGATAIESCPRVYSEVRVLGGAIYASYNAILSFSGTSNFINNSADNGGAIYTGNTVLSFNGTDNFINNSASVYGGATYTDNTLLSFTGTDNFIYNWWCNLHIRQ